MRAALALVPLALLLGGCGGDRKPVSPASPVAIVPGTSDYAPGDVRLSFLVVDRDGQAITSPTAKVWVARGRKAKPFQRTTAKLETTQTGGGDLAHAKLYVAHLRIPAPGTYWVLTEPVGASKSIQAFGTLVVRAHSASIGVGERAPASKTPTLASTGGDLKALTTATPPDRALLRYSVADSLRAKVPFVLVFATPRFCTSRTCGPMVDVVQTAQTRLAGRRVRFIHVEIYEGNDPTKGENRWVGEWRLPTEPYTFLVGADGRVKAKFEGAISVRELEAAVREELL